MASVSRSRAKLWNGVRPPQAEQLALDAGDQAMRLDASVRARLAPWSPAARL